MEGLLSTGPTPSSFVGPIGLFETWRSAIKDNEQLAGKKNSKREETVEELKFEVEQKVRKVITKSEKKSEE